MFFNAQRQFGFIFTLLLQSVSYSTSQILNDTDCVVNALSWGLQDTTTYNGYVSVGKNMTSIVNINGKATNLYVGFHIVELDVNNCSTSDIHQFDTSQSVNKSINMAAYIDSLPNSTVLIGVTSGDASQQLEPSGTHALLSIGVNVTGLQFGSKVAFVAEVGEPTSTVMTMSPPGGDNLKLDQIVQACVVNALSWGYADTLLLNGYISVSEKTPGTTITNRRGFNLFELDVINCTTSDVHNFDTFFWSTNESINMAEYINALPTNTVLIGVTADDASHNLEMNGRNALLSIGVNVTGLQSHSKVAFVAQVGRPALTEMLMGPAGYNLILTVNAPVNLCSTYPCLNGGKCQIFGSSYLCTCVFPFFGTNCERGDNTSELSSQP